MKCQDLFSMKERYLISSAAVVIGTLQVNDCLVELSKTFEIFIMLCMLVKKKSTEYFLK